MKYMVGNIYQCVYDVDTGFVPLIALPTLEEARRYYFTDGFFVADCDEIKYGDMIVILCEPIEIEKNWGYAKVLTPSGFVGWLLIQDNDFIEVNQHDTLSR